MKQIFWALILLIALSDDTSAAEFKLQIIDESDRPIPDAKLNIILHRQNDPRYSSSLLVENKTGADGTFTFSAKADMSLSRIDVSKDGFYPCLITDTQDGIYSREPKQSYTFSMPRRYRPTSLHARKVRAYSNPGQWPENTWLGYDFEKGAFVSPHGKGEVTDIRFYLSSSQDSPRLTPEEMTLDRANPDLKKLTDLDFIRRHHDWNYTLRVAFPEPGSGIIAEPRNWPYCQLRMPPFAPEGGYASTFEMKLSSRGPFLHTAFKDYPGYFLRTRVKLAPDGSVASAHYTKIVGSLDYIHHLLSFTYYYNPVPNDRGLELAPGKNVFKWRRGITADEDYFDFLVSQP
jgi:hypothetical protein